MRLLLIVIIINEVLFIVSVMNNITGALYPVNGKRTKRSAASKVSITESVQKAISSGSSGTTEVMVHPWQLVEDCSKHVQLPQETHGRRASSVW